MPTRGEQYIDYIHFKPTAHSELTPENFPSKCSYFTEITEAEESELTERGMKAQTNL